jgi:penicillin V acylase-like amidase (Ntn superfamily)
MSIFSDRAWHRSCAALLAFAFCMPALPCTTFVVDGDGGPLFGRNYDFEFGEAMLVLNPRGLAKTSATEGAAGPRPATWTARFGSLTFNQYGVGFPTGGVNERGVVVELLWLAGARYPDADARPTVSTLEFIQYLLDQAATLDEALRAAAEVRIRGATPLHFLVSDREGRTATVEFLEGRLVVHRGATLPVRVLTNDRYDRSFEALQQQRAAGDQSLPGDASSLSRFMRAASLLQPSATSTQAPAQRSAADAFQVLDAVAQKGATHWQIVYELRPGIVRYRTAANRDLRSIDFMHIDYSCGAGVRLLDIDRGRGDMSAQWQPYSRDADEAQLRIAYRKTSFLRDQPPESAARDAGKTAAGLRCG